MIYCTNKTWEHKYYKKEQWHRWFAWYPVDIEEFTDGSKIKVWFQTIWRRGEWYDGWEWEYRV